MFKSDQLLMVMFSKVDAPECIKEPDAFVANRQRQKTTNACLVLSPHSSQCPLKPKRLLDDIPKADTYHITEIISTAILLSNARQ